ncbi:MAG: ABC transporter ATP-binding protein [Deltaproteobacteria bacterium]|nr:ABC transporter ATP-binding protein [Deltaproteobacteria bacterium]
MESYDDAPEFLRVEGVRHRFGDREVLRGVNIDVRRGEVFGLLGPNGSGKSTLLAVLAGTLPMQDGKLFLDGRPVKAGDRSLREKIGVVFQSPALDPKLTARQNLQLAGYIQGLSGAVARRRTEKHLELVDLADRADEPVEHFSGGMKRKLDIARAMLHEPELLLLDEPTAGLDEAAFRTTWQRLDAVREGRELTVLLTTHRPDEGERCHRLAVISSGATEVVDTPRALKRRLSGDLVVVTAADREEICRAVRERFSLACTVEDGEVLIECEKGHELVPRLVEAFPAGRLESVALRHPNLADVFFKITGRQLDEENGFAEAAR